MSEEDTWNSEYDELTGRLDELMAEQDWLVTAVLAALVDYAAWLAVEHGVPVAEMAMGMRAALENHYSQPDERVSLH